MGGWPNNQSKPSSAELGSVREANWIKSWTLGRALVATSRMAGLKAVTDAATLDRASELASLTEAGLATAKSFGSGCSLATGVGVSGWLVVGSGVGAGGVTRLGFPTVASGEAVSAWCVLAIGAGMIGDASARAGAETASTAKIEPGRPA